MWDLSPRDALTAAGVDAGTGLSEGEAAARLEDCGPNTLPRVRAHGAIVRFLLQFHSPLIYVLLGSAVAAALIGESAPVAKATDVLPIGTTLADRRNMAYSGTIVTAGSGVGVVATTGARTEIGLIHGLMGRTVAPRTPLTRKIAKFSRVVTVAVLVLGAATFAIGLARGQSGAEMLAAAIALAVGAIPEGLPAMVTIALAFGVARMVGRKAVIRRLPMVETLGSTTVICSDKTGTLTENKMAVVAVVAGGSIHDLQNPARRRGRAGVPARRAGVQRLPAAARR